MDKFSVEELESLHNAYGWLYSEAEHAMTRLDYDMKEMIDAKLAQRLSE